jgi:anaerobic selenocysteine-containing dehydrogenase
MTETIKQPEACNISRRDFLKISGAVGAGAAFLGALPKVNKVMAQGNGQAAYTLSLAENQIYTVCQQCNTQCGLKVKLLDGVVAKVDGNPYNPWNMAPHVAYDTPIQEMAKTEGALCPKGQASIQTTYDPYRLVKVVKRKPGTPRGGGEWVTMDFDTALTEIIEGGDLFGDGPIEGLKDLYALRDSKVALAMSDFVKKILAEKDKDKKAALVKEFKTTFASDLDKMIDPDHPDFGPKNNQLLFFWGRLKAGRSDFISRVIGSGFGTANRHGHTTVCNGSIYFAGKAMSEQFVEGKWADGKKFYWQVDSANSQFIIFVGVNPFEASQGPTNRSPRITTGLVESGLKYVVVDPRLSKTASKAWKWLPNIPGSEGALALALIQQVLQNNKHNVKFLENANKAAASVDQEPTWSNASWLVKIEKGEPGKFLRGSDLGLEPEEREKADGSGTWLFDPFVALRGDQTITFDPNAAEAEFAAEGDLLVDTTVNGIRVKSSLQLLKESADSHTLEEWADITGLRASDIAEVAAEFTSYGRKAAAEPHRGASQHTNGFYNIVAWFSLNLLIGNYDYTGGMTTGFTYDHTGSKDGQPFNLGKLTNGKTTPFGINIIRSEIKYEDSTLFAQDGYPAKRQWYPLASDVYQEILTSAADGYPYPIKAAFIYMGSPAYSLPAGNTNIDILRDPKKIPLVVANDILIGETSMYADYIFPDISNLERWEMAGTQFSMPWKVMPVRNPSVAPLVEEVTVFGQKVPCSLEALLLGIAEKLELPGVGPGGLGDAGDLTHPDHFYLKMVANLAFGDKKPDPEKNEPGEILPDADDDEVRIFTEARRFLPPSVFDLERWSASVGDEWWRKVVYVLNRGGRFQDYAKAYDGAKIKNKYGKQINLYQEKTIGVKNALSGEHYPGLAVYLPGPFDLSGKPIEDPAEYDLRLITNRVVYHTKARTITNYWLLALLPENTVQLNPLDAARLGLKDDDVVKIASATNPDGEWDFGAAIGKRPIAGKVKIIEGLRPGVVTFSLGHGHWATGSTDVVIDGALIKGDPRRVKGIHANAAMRTDPIITNMCLTDPVGASAVFYDTQVKVVKM